MAEAKKPLEQKSANEANDPPVSNGPMQGKTGAELAAMPNDSIYMTNKDAGLSQYTNNLVPQEGPYNTVPGAPTPPKFAKEEYERMDHTTDEYDEYGRRVEVPENRTQFDARPQVP